MKTESQVRHKLSQVRFRHLKREIRNGLSRKSENCKYNGVVKLPMYESQVGVCLYGASDPSTWNRGACDEALGDRASKCSLFECVNSKERLKSEFEDFLKSSDRAHVAERYPDMAALLWVLDLDAPDLGASDPEQDPEGETIGESPPPDPVPDPQPAQPLPDEVIDRLLETPSEPVQETSLSFPQSAWAIWFSSLWARFVGLLRG